MNYRSEAGFALPMAIFFIVIIAAAVAFMSQLQGHQSITTALSVQSARGQLAAEAAVEWAAARKRKDSTFCPASQALLTVNGFAVTVDFAAHSHAEAAATIVMCDVSASAEYASLGSLDHVYRRLEATLWREQ